MSELGQSRRSGAKQLGEHASNEPFAAAERVAEPVGSEQEDIAVGQYDPRGLYVVRNPRKAGDCGRGNAAAAG